jgi:hypothetical protein
MDTGGSAPTVGALGDAGSGCREGWGVPAGHKYPQGIKGDLKNRILTGKEHN